MSKARILLLSFTVALVMACGTTRTVPITGRTQRISVSDTEILNLSKQEYAKYMKSARLSTNSANTEMVRRVGQRLSAAVENYLIKNGMASELSNYSWEFNLVADNSVNAFCLPGGKIVVYEGLLPVTQNEASLAVVLGHEIAHAVAHHSAEQISKQQNQQGILYGASAIADALGVGQTAQSIGGAVVQSGLQLRNLSYSRSHENEADHIGLILAAMAGYDPQVAVAFWQRMATQSKNGGWALLSDHPSDSKRISNIQKWMPEALRYYKPAASVNSQSPTTKKKASTTAKSKTKRR